MPEGLLHDAKQAWPATCGLVCLHPDFDETRREFEQGRSLLNGVSYAMVHEARDRAASDVEEHQVCLPLEASFTGLK